MIFRPRTAWDWMAATLVVALIAGGAASVWWLSRYTLAVRRLTRGVGDTVFYGADGRPWFRLDEQRHDVPLAEIASDLQDAVLAIEDRRFYHHPGIDPIGLARAVLHDQPKRIGRLTVRNHYYSRLPLGNGGQRSQEACRASNQQRQEIPANHIQEFRGYRIPDISQLKDTDQMYLSISKIFCYKKFLP